MINIETWIQEKLNRLNILKNQKEQTREEALKVAKRALFDIEELDKQISDCWAINKKNERDQNATEDISNLR